MLIDLNNSPTNNSEKVYDVCICGAGPAGITLARKLAAAGKKVALFEAGGLQYSEDSQKIYQGDSVGLNYWNGVKDFRLRYFGGTSGHWSGLCSYFDEEEFGKSINGLPGWPIKRKEIFNYFDEAKDIFDLPKGAFKNIKKWPGTNFKHFEFSQSPPTRFGTKYQKELADSKQIDLYINASLTNITLNKALTAVSAIDIRNAENKQFQFKAKKHAIAMGAIETARVLLASNKQVSVGVGNKTDMVGRCFMEHLNVNYGRFAIDKKEPWKNKIHLQAKQTLVENLKISSGEISFRPGAEVVRYGRTAKLKEHFYDLVCKSSTATDLLRKLQRFDCKGDGIITSMVEQSPNLDSRVTLGNKKDTFGMPSVTFNWAINDLDAKTIRTIGVEAAKEMARLGYARVKLADYILDTNLEIPIAHHAHQMGTTRMSADPKYGVVDGNSKVHGISNLYIAGSSVFSTGGACNPTFTIVMLALRLGDHLISE